VILKEKKQLCLGQENKVMRFFFFFFIKLNNDTASCVP
jgi:hypothetical protein